MNPSPKSPRNVVHDSAYERMIDFQAADYYPSCAEVVVKHKKSGKYYKTIYRVYEDDSEWEEPATWRQVKRTETTEVIVRYA